MQLRVVAATGADPSQDPAALVLPDLPPLGPETNTRQVSLNELTTTFAGFDGPVAALLGTLTDAGEGLPEEFDAAVSEVPAVNSIEIWEMFNFTEDAHPIHIHDVQFEVVNRQVILTGETRPPDAWETGRKDTVIAYPGEITRVKAAFDTPGLFIWHCHILEHEDNMMMRPFFVGDETGVPNPTEFFLPLIIR
jgi:FtsP/CotA-like multicopper oxidase with cupredoxin domain